MYQEASLAGAAAQPQSPVAEQLPGNPIPDPHLHAELQPEALVAVEDGQPNGFTELNLAEPLVQACVDLGYTQPTVVQSRAIPLALNEGSSSFIDLMVSSQTGSGKTAAFLLPVLHTLLQQQEAAQEQERIEWQRKVDEAAASGEPAPKRPRRKNPTDRRHFKAAEPGALVLCPTRELAQQVAHDAIDLVKHCKGLRIAHVVGGMPYAIQIARLQNADLVVATPGRLLDLQRSMQIKLEKVQFLVVDEADRMLDLGFAEDLAEIHALTAERRQTMMFSATFAPRIQQLATRVMREPQKIQIEWTEAGQDVPFTASALSDGTLRFICLATVLLQPEAFMPATILIDEPELGLHPFAITMLGAMMKSTAQQHQIIVSTQSVELVNEFDAEDLIVVDKKGGASTFSRPSAESLGEWLQDYTLGELWKKNILGGRPQR